MEVTEVWQQNISKPDDENISNAIWDLSYSPDGSYLFVISGNGMLIFDSEAGELLKSYAGVSKENIYSISISKDGRILATGGSEKKVVLWNGANLTKEKLFTMEGSVQTLSFNPITAQLFVGTTSDIGIYNPESDKKPLEKKSVKNAMKSSSWSPDGRFIAYASTGGAVHIKDSKFNKKASFQKLAPVTCIAWSPLTIDNPESILAVACVDMTISLHNDAGEQFGFERKSQMEIYTMAWFTSGDYLMAGGSGNLVCIYSREGIYLGKIAEVSDWVWGLNIQPKSNRIAVGTNSGEIKVFELSMIDPFSVSHNRYAFRSNLTDLVIQDQDGDKKVRVKCKELVKKISLFKNMLGVQLNSKVLIYIETDAHEDEAEDEDHDGPAKPRGPPGIAYKPLCKFNKTQPSSFFYLGAENFVVSDDFRIQCFDFRENMIREWKMECEITHQKMTEGPPKKEGLLVGLKNGEIYRIFIDNPFPIHLINHDVTISQLDLSANRRKLAVVDNKNNFYMYDIVTKEQLASELKVTSVAFNSEFEDMVAYAGEGLLFIKGGDFPSITLKQNGNLVGFRGAKCRMVHNGTILMVDIPLSSHLFNYIQRKNFKAAYNIASLGVPDQDLKYLGTEALANQEFDIAKRCFTRIKDVGYLDLAIKYERDVKNNTFEEISLKADLLAFDHKVKPASELLQKSGKLDRAIELCIKMRRWNEALAIVKNAQRAGTLNNSDNKYNLQKLLSLQAESEYQRRNWKAAVDLLQSAGDNKRSLEVLIEFEQTDDIVRIMRKLDKKQDEESIKICIEYFTKIQDYNSGKEALLRLGDKKQLMLFHVKLEKWDEALMLSQTDYELKKTMLLPYAEWLAKNNRFEEAQVYYKEAGRADLSMEILEKLSKLSLVQNRFKEAGNFYWILARENLKSIKQLENPSKEDQLKLEKFHQFNSFAEIYYAYNLVYEYVKSPLQLETTPGHSKVVFNAARFILAKSKNQNYEHISLMYVNYVLTKISALIGGYKVQRVAFEKLNNLIVPPEWLEELELTAMKSRARPLMDKDDLIMKCARCGNKSQVIAEDCKCGNCFHTFIQSPLSFSVLPLIEFKVEGSIPHEKVVELISQEKTDEDRAQQKKPKTSKKRPDRGGDMWDINGNGAPAEHLVLGNPDEEESDAMEQTIFGGRVQEVCDAQIANNEYVPVKLDEYVLGTLESEQVFWSDYRQYHPQMKVGYYKVQQDGFDLVNCPRCCRFFKADEFDLYFIEHGSCPFCKSKDLSF